MAVAGFLYDHVAGGSLPLVETVAPLDWLLAASLLTMATFVVVPLVRTSAETKRYWARLRADRLGFASFCYLLGFVAIGLVGPILMSEPSEIAFVRGFQPPIWTTVSADQLIYDCVGRMAGGRCHGTVQYPLGTTSTGKDVLAFVVLGAGTALRVGVVAATLIVPTGVSVGLLAAYVGGRTDEALMRFAEVLQTVPAVIVYLLFWQFFIEHRLLVLIGVFGLMNWGGLARLVRNETLQRREELYVRAAESAGADGRQIARWHLLPNISGSVLTNVTLQIPFLILTEAALSFIVLPMKGSGEVTLGDPTVVSWGQTIFLGIRSEGLVPGWWITVFPSLALILTVLAFNWFGRALDDVLDPRPR